MLTQHLLQWQCVILMHWHVCLTPLSALCTTDVAEIRCPRNHVCCHTPWRSLYTCALPASPALKTMEQKEWVWTMLVHHHTFSHHLKAKSSSKLIFELHWNCLVVQGVIKWAGKASSLGQLYQSHHQQKISLLKPMRMSALILNSSFATFCTHKGSFPFLDTIEEKAKAIWVWSGKNAVGICQVKWENGLLPLGKEPTKFIKGYLPPGEFTITSSDTEVKRVDV